MGRGPGRGALATRTIRALVEYGIDRFEKAGLSYGHGTLDAVAEAAWLVLHAAGLPPQDLDSHLERRLTDSEQRAAKALIAQRIRTRKPAAYLLHEAWLGAHRFYVDERVIVPRSFIAELLSGQPALPLFRTPTTLLDLCTGSGCLAILAALAWPDAKVDASDVSGDALEVAKKNVAGYKLARRVRLVKSDLFAALDGRTYDLIISNPPYVKAASMRKLPEEYRKEPAMALASGVDGLEHTHAILGAARKHLNPGGRLVVEIGHNRKALEKAYPKLPFEWPRVSAGKGFVFALGREDLP